jgi:tetratricopeptide (TPR) repeat protein
MNLHLERGKLLLSQNRVGDAEAEFKKALERNPNDGYAMGWLAECAIQQKQYAQALEMAEYAMQREPTSDFLLYTYARSNFYNKKMAKAEETIEQALALYPRDADFFLLRAHISFYQEKWQKALDSAGQGLEIEPENVNLINIRTQALIKLNRKEEAAATIDFALHKAPEDSYSHANKGWVALEQGKYDDAFRHFRESLRLSPENDFAKTGLKEAIKSKNILYRGMLKYFLWIAKMDSRNRWAFIIGAYILYRLIVYVAENNPAIAPLLYPLIAFYVLFALSSWIALPLSNLFLRLHPIGKYALDKDELTGANLIGGVLGGAIIAGGIYLFTNSGFFMVTALYLLLMLVPIGGLFSVDASGKARRYLIFYTLSLAIVGALWIVFPDNMFPLMAFVVGIFAYGWVANYFISKDAKEFR